MRMLKRLQLTTFCTLLVIALAMLSAPPVTAQNKGVLSADVVAMNLLRAFYGIFMWRRGGSLRLLRLGLQMRSTVGSVLLPRMARASIQALAARQMFVLRFRSMRIRALSVYGSSSLLTAMASS